MERTSSVWIVAVKYSIEEASRVVLAAKKYVVDLEAEKIRLQKYDKPCTKYLTQETKGLFLMWALQNADLLGGDDYISLVISRLNRWASNGVLPSSITNAEVQSFLLTDEGVKLTADLS